MAQALVRFLDNQYIDVDGSEIKFVKGIFAIFGHGNVVGLGQALEEDCGQLSVHQGRNEQEWRISRRDLPARCVAIRFMPAPPQWGQGPPI